MESTSTMNQLVATIARSRAGYQVPSQGLGMRCVEGDLLGSRGHVRPKGLDLVVVPEPGTAIGAVPFGTAPFAGPVSSGVIRQT